MTKDIPFDPRFNNGGEGELRVPGFGLPIEYWPYADEGKETPSEVEVRFRHGANDFRGERLTEIEIHMLRLMNALTEKPDWAKKVFDEGIVAKWKQEAMAANDKISERVFAWCITEVRDKAKQYDESRYVVVLNSESACIKSDHLIEPELQAELKANVQPLLDRPYRDWHPGTDERVLNLVHPSLYPLVYGRTRVLTSGTVALSDVAKYIGQGEIAEADQFVNDSKDPSSYRLDVSPSSMKNKELWSNQFQWLPAEVKFQGEKGTDVNITSYINNLHPDKYPKLYSTVEKMISKAIPLWNEVLIRGLYGRYPERIKTFGTTFKPEQPTWMDWQDDDNRSEEKLQRVRDYVALPNAPHYEPGDEEDEIPDDWDTNEEHAQEWPLSRIVETKWKMIRQLEHPEPGVAFTYEEWKAGAVDKAVVAPDHPSQLAKHTYYQIRLEEQFRDRGLQVIVKLASVELTPDNPTYEGGSWHLEGMLNEHIVATAIYYYDVENITDSALSFRQEDIFHETGIAYAQEDHEPIYELYGTSDDDFSVGVSQLGSISTPGGRLLVFPNTLQHAVGWFGLADKTKPGHRRFLVLWLVDPHLRIMSTANVPPQQHEWWAPLALEMSGINRFPAEVGKMIMDNADDWPMGLEEAERLRLDLMAERTTFGDTVEENLVQYNLCEH